MTLIAFATYGDHAEIITDTSRYSPNGRVFSRASKQLPIPHLDMAVVVQGDSQFGTYAKFATFALANESAASLDDVADHAPVLYQQAWRDLDPGRERSDSVVFLIGYSPREEQFVAYAVPSDRDFQPLRVRDTWVMPAPWSYRPSGLELRRMLADADPTDPADVAFHKEAAHLWRAKPAPPRPRTVLEWVQLAKTVRQQRALDHFKTVFVAGQVMHTRLDRGGRVTTQPIHEFDDTGDEFRQMISYTHHPMAQMAPCHCGSGLPFMDCHLAQHYADGRPCSCGSGDPFDQCCRVAGERVEALTDTL